MCWCGLIRTSRSPCTSTPTKRTQPTSRPARRATSKAFKARAEEDWDEIQNQIVNSRSHPCRTTVAAWRRVGGGGGRFPLCSLLATCHWRHAAVLRREGPDKTGVRV